MNSSTSEVLWPSPVGAHEASTHSTNTQTELMIDVATDILTAIGSGAFTSSSNVASEVSQDVQYVTALLNQAGYSCSNNGTSLVVSW
jgi:hypothetical protein